MFSFIPETGVWRPFVAHTILCCAVSHRGMPCRWWFLQIGKLLHDIYYVFFFWRVSRLFKCKPCIIFTIHVYLYSVWLRIQPLLDHHIVEHLHYLHQQTHFAPLWSILWRYLRIAFFLDLQDRIFLRNATFYKANKVVCANGPLNSSLTVWTEWYET